MSNSCTRCLSNNHAGSGARCICGDGTIHGLAEALQKEVSEQAEKIVRLQNSYQLLCKLVRLLLPHRAHGCICDACLREEIIAAEAAKDSG